MSIKNNQIETPFTVAEQTKLSGISTGAEVNPALASQAVAEAGLDNSQYMSSLRVNQAIAALGGGGGENNTASNEGVGTGLFIQKTGVNLEFKTISAGTGVTLGGDAQNLIVNASAGGLTDTDGLAEGSVNFYYTEGRVSSNTSVAANTAKISADGSIATHSDVTITSPTNGQVMTYNGSVWVNAAATGGGAALEARDEGISLDSAVTVLNFIGAGVSAVQNGAGVIDITIAGGGGGGALNDLSDVTISGAANGEVLTFSGGTWVNSASGSSLVSANIQIPAAASLSLRLAGATGLPAGWSLALGNDGAADGGFGGTANDIVIIHNESKPAIIQVYKDFGGIVRQDANFDPTSLELLQSNSYNQIFLKNFISKAGSPAVDLTIMIP